MMRLLPMWEPWASMVAWEFKKVETRPRRTLYHLEVAIFATSKWDREVQEAIMGLAGIPAVAPFFLAHRMTVANLGRILAVVNLVDCEPTVSVFEQYPELDTPAERAVGNYSPGRFGYVMDNVRKLHTPIPYKAHQGFYTLDADTEAKVRAQL